MIADSPSFRAARWVALLVPAALIAGAWWFQLFRGLAPCPMCHWQRWPHYTAIVLAALAFVVPGHRNRFGLIVLAALAIAVSGGIGVYQAGTQYHWWQGETACTATIAHGLSADELLKQIMAAPIERCDEIGWSLFGISLAGFNAIFSLGGAALTAALLFRGRRR